MKDYTNIARESGIGRTPALCQDALIELLEEMFRGKLFLGPGGRRQLKVYKQDLPIPTNDDEDVDTDMNAAPYIKVSMAGGSIQDNNGPQVVEFNLVICTYDPGTERVGYQDVCNIKEDIVQRVCAEPYFGGVFTVLKPVAWAIQQDTSPPYYFGAVVINCTAPAMNQDAAMAELV